MRYSPGMKPTIGRSVHLCISGNRIPAVITYVHSDTCVNVYRQDGGGSESSVLLETESHESAQLLNTMTTPHRSWSWPPRV